MNQVILIFIVLFIINGCSQSQIKSDTIQTGSKNPPITFFEELCNESSEENLECIQKLSELCEKTNGKLIRDCISRTGETFVTGTCIKIQHYCNCNIGTWNQQIGCT